MPDEKTPVKTRSWIKKIAGPGLVTGASDDDPSGIATYSQAGAAFGLSTLWTAVLTYPLMASIQEMCARIGLITKHGLTGVLKQHYPRPLLWMLVFLSFPAIVLNIGADLAAMGAVANMLMPTLPAHVFSIAIGLLLVYLLIRWPYRRIAAWLKWLCLSLLCYLVVPFLFRQDWGDILQHTLVPDIRLDKAFIGAIVGILGTTISPYLFFWQASMEVEEVQMRKLVVDKRVIHGMQKDIRSGMFFSNLVFYFIILTAGTVLYREGIHRIDDVRQAAEALRPLAGNFSYLLFSMGVLGTGMLAIPVLSGALSYMISEAFDWDEGLDKKFNEAKGFYLVMIVSILAALLINYTGLSPVRALIITAIVYGVTAPVLILLILIICNNKSIMGEHTNGPWSNFLGITALLLMTAAAIGLLIL